MSLDYLTDLHQYYDNWLLYENNVVVVDVGDIDVYEVSILTLIQ